jgi:hypothetical protein
VLELGRLTDRVAEYVRVAGADAITLPLEIHTTEDPVLVMPPVMFKLTFALVLELDTNSG